MLKILSDSFTQGFYRLMGVFTPTAIRIVFGLGFVMAGMGKLQDLEKTKAAFVSLGIVMPEIMMPLVIGVQIIGGAMVLVGFGTRLASLLLAGNMLVALLTADKGVWSQGMGAIVDATPFVYMMAMGVLLTYGAGPLSLDAWLAKRRGQKKEAT